jgi:hypothetical protein
MGFYPEYITEKYEADSREALRRAFKESLRRHNLATAYQMDLIDYAKYLLLSREIQEDQDGRAAQGSVSKDPQSD